VTLVEVLFLARRVIIAVTEIR